jgi:hypothetical protein
MLRDGAEGNVEASVNQHQTIGGIIISLQHAP